jgi:RNA polymerase sigma factor, sigma-70 family
MSSELVNREKLFVDLFNKNYKALCLYAVKFCGDFPEAEDIVQEVFVRFWDVYQEEAEGISARSYLYRMVRNACIDLSRAKKYETVDVGLLSDQLEYFFHTESEEDSKIDKLLEAIEALPDKCRYVFTAICVDNKKYKEVAEEMHVSLNTVKTQLARSLKLLREGLNKEDFKLFLTFFAISE